MKILSSTFAVFMSCAVAVAPAGAQVAGTATRIGVAGAVQGKVGAFAQGPKEIGRVITSGKPLYLNEKIVTGPDSHLQIMLLDETVFTIGPNSTMILDEFVYDPKTDAGKVSAQINRGAFRFITGKIGHRQPSNMKVKFPVGTMGIRGTIVAGVVSEHSTMAVLLGPGPAMRIPGERIGAFTLGNAAGAVEVNRPGFGTHIDSLAGRPSVPMLVPQAVINSIQTSLSSPPPAPKAAAFTPPVAGKPDSKLTQAPAPGAPPAAPPGAVNPGSPAPGAMPAAPGMMPGAMAGAAPGMAPGTMPGAMPAAPGMAPGAMPVMPAGMPTMPGGMPPMPGGMPAMPGGMPPMPGGMPAMPGGMPPMPGEMGAMPAMPPMPMMSEAVAMGSLSNVPSADHLVAVLTYLMPAPPVPGMPMPGVAPGMPGAAPAPGTAPGMAPGTMPGGAPMPGAMPMNGAAPGTMPGGAPMPGAMPMNGVAPDPTMMNTAPGMMPGGAPMPGAMPVYGAAPVPDPTMMNTAPGVMPVYGAAPMPGTAPGVMPVYNTAPMPVPGTTVTTDPTIINAPAPYTAPTYTYVPPPAYIPPPTCTVTAAGTCTTTNTQPAVGTFIPSVDSIWDEVRAIPSGTGNYVGSGTFGFPASAMGPAGGGNMNFQLHVDFGAKTIGGGGTSFIAVNPSGFAPDSTQINAIPFGALTGTASIMLNAASGNHTNPAFNGTQITLSNSAVMPAATARVNLNYAIPGAGATATGTMTGSR